jgi:hypothetical protein
MSFNSLDNEAIKREMQQVIDALKEKGITHSTKEGEVVGLGDIVESTLKSFGITEERFKQWFNLKGCNCQERKKWLNNLFSWNRNR